MPALRFLPMKLSEKRRMSTTRLTEHFRRLDVRYLNFSGKLIPIRIETLAVKNY